MLKRNSRLLLALSVATPVLFAACTDNNIFGPNEAAGTYQLTVFAGHSVPFTFAVQAGDQQYPNGASIRVLDGDLTLNSNGTFVETNNFFVTPTGESGFNDAFVSTGTWTVNGTTLTLQAPPQNNADSRFVTATFTVDNSGDRINYQEDTGSGPQSYEYMR